MGKSTSRSYDSKLECQTTHICVPSFQEENKKTGCIPNGLETVEVYLSFTFESTGILQGTGVIVPCGQNSHGVRNCYKSVQNQ